MSRFSDYFWLDNRYYVQGYIDDIYEPPFTFDYFLKVEGATKNVIEYKDEQLVYTTQNLSYYCNGIKQWATKPMKPAKEYYLKNGYRPIVIGNRCFFSGMRKLVCIDLESQKVLWEINDPGKKAIEKKFKVDLRDESNFESFEKAIWFDENYVYFRCYTGFFLKVDYIKGIIIDLLEIMNFDATKTFSGYLVGEIYLSNDDRERFRIYDLSKEKIVFDYEYESYAVLSKGNNFIYGNLIISNNGYQRYCHQLVDNLPLKWNRKIEANYLCADKDNMYFYRDKKLICINMVTGDTVWEKIYSDYDFEGLVDSNQCFIDNKYIHGTFRSCGHLCIDKKNGDIVYFVAFIDERKWRMQDRKGEISNEINSDNTNYYGLNFVTPGKKHIYYSLYEEGEYVRLSPSNKKD